MRTAIVVLILALVPAEALAGVHRCFNEGPYLRIIGGATTVTFDKNMRTDQSMGNDIEGAYGFEFGWNLWDSTAPELEVKYATSTIGSNREHVFNVDLNIKYSFIIGGLTGLGDLHILPFVKGGPASMIAAVPGDPLADYKLMAIWGLGANGAAGVDFTVKRYVSFGVMIQGEILYIPSFSQTVNGVSQKIIAGGWEPQVSLLGAAGVHF